MAPTYMTTYIKAIKFTFMANNIPELLINTQIKLKIANKGFFVHKMNNKLAIMKTIILIANTYSLINVNFNG